MRIEAHASMRSAEAGVTPLIREGSVAHYDANPLSREKRVAPEPNHLSEDLMVISNRKIEQNPTGGMSEAVNQALSAKNGESNGNGHKSIIPERKMWTAWDGKRRETEPEQPYERETVTTPSGTSYEVIGVPLVGREYDDYYLGYSNMVLWPLNHGYPEKAHVENTDFWEAYKKVNRKDAAIIADNINPDTLVWYQDYHKILGAKYLREELTRRGMTEMPPMALFMHTPVATPADFARLPQEQRTELLDGYLNFDLVGFHTKEYLDDFLLTVKRFKHDAVILRTPDGTTVSQPDGRRTIVDTFPIGIDPKFLQKHASTPEVMADVQAIRATQGDKTTIFNAARRDYMKGFPEGLDAINALFEQHPATQGNVVYIQGDQPSRAGITDYDEIDGIIDNKVNQISERFQTSNWTPIERYVDGFKRPLMLSRLRASDILFTSSTRDGFCLVPLEFIELNDQNGVAVVSDKIGAASVYEDALLTVNIYNPRETAEALYYAYNMPEQERADMLEKGRAIIRDNDIHTWANRQIGMMNRIKAGTI